MSFSSSFFRSHLGLARRLLQALLRAAAEAGLQRMVGDVLATNQAMLSLARSLGFDVVRHPDGGAQVLRVQKTLSAGDAADALAAAVTLAPIAPAPSGPKEWAAT